MLKMKFFLVGNSHESFMKFPRRFIRKPCVTRNDCPLQNYSVDRNPGQDFTLYKIL